MSKKWIITHCSLHILSKTYICSHHQWIKVAILDRAIETHYFLGDMLDDAASPVYWLSRATITNYHKLRGLNQYEFSLYVSGGQKFKIKAWIELIPSEGSEGKIVLCFSPCFWWLLGILGVPWFVDIQKITSTSIFTWSSPLCLLCLWQNFPLLTKKQVSALRFTFIP